MVKLRLRRKGRTHHPVYDIIAIDGRNKRDGAFLESLGHYYPQAKDAKDKIKVNLEAVQAWQGKGAQVSQTVGELLKTLAK